MQVRNYSKTTVSDHFQASQCQTYCCFTTCSLAELIKVDEELSDSDAIFGDKSLDAGLDVLVASQCLGGLSH